MLSTVLPTPWVILRQDIAPFPRAECWTRRPRKNWKRDTSHHLWSRYKSSGRQGNRILLHISVQSHLIWRHYRPRLRNLLYWSQSYERTHSKLNTQVKHKHDTGKCTTARSMGTTPWSKHHWPFRNHYREDARNICMDQNPNTIWGPLQKNTTLHINIKKV